MRVIAIGDIHGCSTALNELLDDIVLQPQDTIVTLGDYVDRGPDSRGTIDTLLQLGHYCHLVALRGNHELMMLEARDNVRALNGWMVVGGEETLISYGGLQQIPDAHWDFIEKQCVAYWENETHFFVHAGAYPDEPLFEQPDYKLYWDRFDHPPPHESGKIMVCGHTSQKSGYPINIGHAVCIDTWACGNGWLTALDVTTGRLWQANRFGQKRQFWLEDIDGNT